MVNLEQSQITQTNLETSLTKVALEATAGSGLHGVPPKLDVAATRQHTFPRQDKQLLFFPRSSRNMHITFFRLISY